MLKSSIPLSIDNGEISTSREYGGRERRGDGVQACKMAKKGLCNKVSTTQVL